MEDEAAGRQRGKRHKECFDAGQTEPFQTGLGRTGVGNAVGVKQERAAGREGRLVLLKAGHGRRKRAYRRAGAVKLLHGIRAGGVGGRNQRRFMAAAGVDQFSRAGFQRPDKNRAEALKIRVRLDHGIDGGKRLGRGQADRKAVGQQLAHMFGLQGLFRAMPGDIADDHGDRTLLPRVGVQDKRIVEVAARRRGRRDVGIRGGVFPCQRLLSLPQLRRAYYVFWRIHAYRL